MSQSEYEFKKIALRKASMPSKLVKQYQHEIKEYEEEK